MKISLVTTTIHIPKLLEDYATNARDNSIDNLKIIVSGDAKTPKECKNFCKEIENKFSYETIYLGLEEQYSEYSKLANYIPENSISRRNFSTLKAYEIDSDIIIMIDDDNFPTFNQNYFKMHTDYLKESYVNVIDSNNGWFDPCSVLSEKKDRVFYHRGFPYNYRYETEVKVYRARKKSAVNEGLWIDAPDTDAVSWINFPNLQVVAFNYNLYGNTFSLSPKTWSPLNSQNTALIKDAVPSYFLNPFNKRYDDIWAGFMLEKVAKHLNFSISFGLPLVEQRRNPHNYIVDLNNEIDGMLRTPSLISVLQDMNLESKTFNDSTEEIIQRLPLGFEDVKKGYETWLSYF